MSALFVLRDLDNRDESGAPFTFTGSLREVVAYVDGPVRSDVQGASQGFIDEVVDRLRDGETDFAALHELSIEIKEVPVMSVEVLSSAIAKLEAVGRADPLSEALLALFHEFETLATHGNNRLTIAAAGEQVARAILGEVRHNADD